jgi:phosphoribosylformimino-5-aminoimidazole carboxamide ribotide isomerase
MSEWAVYPAIDLRRGCVVRLRQGDPARETTYASDPLQVATLWRTAGAEWVHVVNLDGAFDEADDENRVALQRILTTGLRVQFGGGLRRPQALQQAIDLGVSRAVIGTAAIERPALVEQAVQALGADRVAVAIDWQEDTVRTHGWRQGSGISAFALAKRCAAQGVRWAVCTHISRDGTGTGLNVTDTKRLAQQTGLHVIASGGVSSLEDVQLAHQAGLSGVIIGRALYEGQVSLRDALNVGSTDDAS